MVHVVLLLPVIGLILFWILPISIALPLYIVILITSLILYKSIMKTMKLPVKTGEKGLIGLEGKVVNITGDMNLVSVHGELWNAVSESHLTVGESVEITDVNDLTLTVDELKPPVKR
jgi:membrane protein implicated in regulation of membrane protease activity